MENNIFNTNYSTSNPFSMNKKSVNDLSAMDGSLAQAYQRLEEIKKKQNQIDALSSNLQQANQQSYRTVFNDISDEFKDLPQDEINFIVTSKEYQALNAKYQDEFSQFLISKFSNEYLQTGKQKTLEEMLNMIRTKKEEYKKNFKNEINEIRDQNKALAERNNQLAEMNEELQKQLKQIQSQLVQE